MNRVYFALRKLDPQARAFIMSAVETVVLFRRKEHELASDNDLSLASCYGSAAATAKTRIMDFANHYGCTTPALRALRAGLRKAGYRE